MTAPRESIVAAVEALDAAIVWAGLQALCPLEWRRLTADDPETGERYDGPSADQDARDILATALEEAEERKPGRGWHHVDLLWTEQERRRQAKREALERKAQEREEEVPEWVYTAGMEVW